MIKVIVTTGDVTKSVEVDAIVTLINSSGMWFGGVDGAIMRVAGNIYHAQAASRTLTDGMVVVAKKASEHKGNFKDVIFVVDDLCSPLSNLVYSALLEAKTQKYEKIAFPLMRTGVMLGAVEPNVQAVVEQMRIAIEKFRADGDWNLDIHIVVYNDPESAELLLKNLTTVKK